METVLETVVVVVVVVVDPYCLLVWWSFSECDIAVLAPIPRALREMRRSSREKRLVWMQVV